MKELRRRYLVSFLAVAVLIFLGATFVIVNLRHQETNSRVINVAGRQRMLSQKITKIAWELDHAQINRAEKLPILRQLSDALVLFDKSYDALQYGSTEFGIAATHSDEIQALYNDINDEHQLISNAGYEILKAVALDSEADIDRPVALLKLNEGEFLTKMNNIVFAHDTESFERLRQSRYIIIIVCTLIWLAMWLIWYLIIRPSLEQSRRVDEVKSEFLSVASHQLRTPLSSIGWYAEMLSDGEAGKVGKQQQEFLGEITVAQKRIARIINQLLYISQIELGRMKIRPVSMEIEPVLQVVLKEYKAVIASKKLIFSINIAKNIKRILLDEELIKIVLDEVLSNATKYTPEGGEVMLKVGKRLGGISIVVTDTGVGVPADQVEEIFSRFFRADNVRAMDTDGTGVGLFLVKTIVERAGGQVEFTSRINKGSRMEIWLPKDGMIAG